jgi:uncharacterized membrane protein YhaH (DUF805 family)
VLTTLFGDLASGRLKRLPYLGYTLLLILAGTVFIFVLASTLGGFEDLYGGDFEQTRKAIRDRITLPALFAFVTAMVLMGFASFNLLAKRLRDTGLPGWKSVLAMTVAALLLTIFVSQRFNDILQALISLALFVIPSDAFAGD